MNGLWTPQTTVTEGLWDFVFQNVARMIYKFSKRNNKNYFGDLFKPYREIVVALVPDQLFINIAPNSLIRVNLDNTNIVSWINKG